MTSLKRARIVWTIVFLGVTLVAIVMEIVAGIFHPAGTIPWTEYLAQYVPWPIQLVAYVVLAVWLPFHFWRHDRLRTVAFQSGKEYGIRLGRMAVASERKVLAGNHPSACCSHGYVWGSAYHTCSQMPSYGG